MGRQLWGWQTRLRGGRDLKIEVDTDDCDGAHAREMMQEVIDRCNAGNIRAVLNAEGAEPKGYGFYDGKSKRFMRLVYEGPWKDWIVYKHPDGQWVSLRKATNDDWHALAQAMSATLHT